MVQVLVMSDTHGNESVIRRVLEKHLQVEAVVHLGDGAAEAQRVAAEDPRAWHIVRGNCDIGQAVPDSMDIVIGGARLYLTHGYRERVKSGLLTLTYTAKEHEAAAALYGHTHIADFTFYDRMLLLNPGSLGNSGTYALLEITNGDLYPRMQML